MATGLQKLLHPLLLSGIKRRNNLSSVIGISTGENYSSSDLIFILIGFEMSLQILGM